MSQTIPLLVAAGGVETAGTPTEYREAQHGDGGFRLSAATLTVELLDNPARARYQLDCRLKTTGETAAYFWYYDVPADRGVYLDPNVWIVHDLA